jgi:branched-chain amino acid transport system permease protein
MSHLGQMLFDGLSSGAGYVLVGLGFSMIFGVLGVLNVAQSDFYMLGAYAGYAVLGLTGASLVVGLSVGLLAGIVVGVVFYAVVVRQVRHDQQLAVFVAALGLSMFLQNGVARIAGPDQQSFPQLVAQTNYRVGGVVIAKPGLVLIVATLVLAGLVMLWLRVAPAGRDIRAVAESRFIAGAVGIDVRRTMVVAVVVSCVIATMGGVLLGNSLATITPFVGTNLGLKMMIVVLVAGAGSLGGTVVVGFALGIAESLTVAYVSSRWQDMTGLVALVAVLLVRPDGLFGQRARIG